MLFVGYFEGLTAQRAIAWKCADSLSVRTFLGLELTEAAPDHSSLTRIRQRLPLEVHVQVFQWVLEVAQAKGAAAGQGAGHRRDDAGGQRGDEVDGAPGQRREVDGVPAPAGEGRRDSRIRATRSCAASTASARTRRSATPSGRRRSIRTARIMKMKDGRTHFSYKAEHAIDRGQRSGGGRGDLRRATPPTASRC